MTASVASPDLERALIKLYRELASRDELILADEVQGSLAEMLKPLILARRASERIRDEVIRTIEDEWSERSRRR